MSNLEFSNDNKLSAENAEEQDTAPFDPENPEAELIVPKLPEDATFFQRAGHYFTLAKLFKDQKLKSLRPWKEFADREEFSIPGKLEALSRVSDNISYFNSNYVVLVSLMSIYILITNLMFMIGMVLCGAIYYWIKLKASMKEPITIGSTELSSTQSYFGLFLLSLLTFYATDGSSTVFWLVTCAAVLVLGHATCRKPVTQGANVNPAFSFA